MVSDKRKESNNLIKLLRSKYPNQPCCNCGSKEKVEWHHIVPITQGGLNIESNLMPLCWKCHKAVHGHRESWNYNAGKNGGRKQKIVYNAKCKETMLLFVDGKIGREEASIRIGTKDKRALGCNSKYKFIEEFKKDTGITQWHNTVDCKIAKQRRDARCS